MSDRKVSGYLLVTNKDVDEFQRLVNENISRWNWVPLGAPIITHRLEDSLMVLTQAMVKYAPADY